ncbi:MAG: MotA/TolQ/ExbB proton channel family protein [Candidatus Glassbacteria bacterium]
MEYYTVMLSLMLQGGSGNGFGEILLRTGAFAKVILLIIFFLSVFAWAIMYHKYRLLKRVGMENGRFLALFRKANALEDALTASREFSRSTLLKLMNAGYRELKELANINHSSGNSINSSGVREDILMTLERAISGELRELERYLVFLAIVSTIAPFLGLLGTVWGIMHAFMDIGTYGSANLSVVGPGIAEALITTIAGLGAAIPAVMGYNYFVSKVKSMTDEMDNFASEFMSSLIKRGVM